MVDGLALSGVEACTGPQIVSAVMLAAALDSPSIGDHPAGRWSTRRAREWLQKSGVGFRQRNGTWATTPERLGAAFPDILYLLLQHLRVSAE